MFQLISLKPPSRVLNSNFIIYDFKQLTFRVIIVCPSMVLGFKFNIYDFKRLNFQIRGDACYQTGFFKKMHTYINLIWL